MKLADLLLVAAGGVLGAWARYGLTAINAPRFPYGTLAVNLIGCLLMGVLMAGTETGVVKSEWRLLIGIGFLGALTTFSTFSGETLAFLNRGSFATALLYIGVSVAGCLLLVTIGYRVAMLLWR